MNKAYSMSVCMACSFLMGCTQYSNDVILGNSDGYSSPKSDQSQLEKRSYQSRQFSTDTNTLMRGLILSLQDQNYNIERTDKKLNTVSGTRSAKGFTTRITVTLRSKGPKKTIVRANAIRNSALVEDPLFYQDFFNALSKSLFLQAQEDD